MTGESAACRAVLWLGTDFLAWGKIDVCATKTFKKWLLVMSKKLLVEKSMFGKYHCGFKSSSQNTPV